MNPLLQWSSLNTAPHVRDVRADLKKLCTGNSLSCQFLAYWVRVSVAPPDESRQRSLQHEILKEVSNHDVIRQVGGLPVSS